MPRLPSFRFSSITHRLIVACVVAAIVIYSLSFWHMRQLVQQGVGSWMMQLAQSRVDTVATAIEGQLHSLEQVVQLIAQDGQTSGNQPSAPTNPRWQSLVAQQPLIHRIAVRFARENAIGWQAVRAGRSDTPEILDDHTTALLLNRCQQSASSAESFWTPPYPLDAARTTMGVTYCRSDRAVIGQPLNQAALLAVEVTLDWVTPLVQNHLKVMDNFHHVQLGQSLVLALPDRQWLVHPDLPTQTLSWFSPDHLPAPTTQPPQSPFLPTQPAQILSDNQGTFVFTTVPSTGWLVGIAFPKSELGGFFRRYLWVIIASMVKDMLLMCGVIALASQRTTHPLRSLITSTEEIAQGRLDTVLPAIPQHDEVGRLGKAFRHMQHSLQTYIHELQVTTAAKQKMESELSIASQIQRSMLPRTLVADGLDCRYELSALHQPARVVGGDLYDFFLLGDDYLCFVIGDVADKGVPAALLMARTVTLIRLMAKQTSTPVEILSTVNGELCPNNEECLFVTLFCGVLDLATGRLSYASGGHEPPLLVRDRQVAFLDINTGPPLGLDENATFPSCETTIQPNDLLLLYTDGLTEAMNPAGGFFSEARLLATIAAHPPSNPSRAVRIIQHFHHKFVAEAPQSDDLTLLVLQYQPSGPFPKEVTIVEWKITINSELTELEKVRQRLGEMLQKKRLAVELIENAQLIAEEVLVNIIQYAYANQCHQQIDLEVRISPNGVRMTFEDWGKPFNPLTEIDTPDLSMNDEERSLGGLGFYLVRELADRLDYTYQDGKNVLQVFQVTHQP